MASDDSADSIFMSRYIRGGMCDATILNLNDEPNNRLDFYDSSFFGVQRYLSSNALANVTWTQR